MVAASNDFLSARIHSCKTQRGAGNRAAANKKTHHLRNRDTINQHLSDFQLHGMGGAEDGALCYLLSERCIDGRIVVAEKDRPKAQQKVKVFVAVDIPETRAVGALREDGIAHLQHRMAPLVALATANHEFVRAFQAGSGSVNSVRFYGNLHASFYRNG